MKLDNGRRGLALLGLIVVVVIVGAFLIFHHKNNKPAVVTIETFIDPTDTYSFKIPSNWKVGTATVKKAPPAGADLSIQTDIENTSVIIPGAPIIYGSTKNFIEVQLNETSDLHDLFCENISSGCNPESLTINGNPALFQRIVYNNSSYETIDFFAINHGSKTVEGYFIESRKVAYTPTVPGTNKSSGVRLPVFNESGSYGAFRTLVHSIKFINE